MPKGNKFFSKLKALGNRVWDFLYPDFYECIFCGEEINENKEFACCNKCLDEYFKGRKICLKCGDVITSKSNYCLACKKEICEHYEFARAPFVYENKATTIVHNLKYNNGKWLAKYMAEFMKLEFEEMAVKVDCIIPIPLHKKRFKERGYNQSELLAKALSKKINLPLVLNNLIKVKETTTQTKLTKLERKENLNGCFEIKNRDEIVGKNILLLDDVFTTGATTEEASRVLKSAGANKIYILTFAHTPRPIKFEK